MNPDDASFLQKEYADVRRAVKTAGTLLTLLMLGVFYVEFRTVPDFRDIFENMVAGGQDALPPLTKLVLGWNYHIYLSVACLSLGLLGFMWGSARTLSSTVWLSFAAVSLPLLGFVLFRIAMHQPLITVITKFQG